jgi:hypothetical protein
MGTFETLPLETIKDVLYNLDKEICDNKYLPVVNIPTGRNIFGSNISV